MSLFDRRREPTRERTSEDRERARAQRAARRAEREGRPAGEAAPPPLEAPPGPPAQPPTEAQPPAATEPVPAQPPPTDPEPDSAARPAPAPPAPAAPDPAPESAPLGGRPFEGASVVLDSEPIEDWSALDEPSGEPRVRRLGRPRREPAMSLPPRPAAGAPSRRAPLTRMAAATGLVLAVAALGFAVVLFQPLKGDGSGSVSVTIPRGATVADAGRRLAQHDVISSAFLFRVRAKLRGGAEVKPGRYRLGRGMSYGAALDALAEGPPEPPTTTITITEGRTRREASALLARTSLRGSYAAATRRSPLLDPRDYGAPRRTPHLEGFLFPATYEVRVGALVGDLVRRQLQTFKQQFAKVDLRYARSKNLTPYEVLVIASMIEREAMVARERRLVAAVIYNRLRLGYPLGIDATLRYALGNQTRALRQSELQLDSPYNTRNRQGLPPTPIGNPGLASIQAAANPARSKVLYFVVKPGTCGEHAFSTTEEQFQRDAQRYSAAREARGGRSPVECR